MTAYDDAERLGYFKALVAWFLTWAGAGYLFERAHVLWVQIGAAFLVAIAVLMTFRTLWLWRRAVRRNPRPRRLD